MNFQIQFHFACIIRHAWVKYTSQGSDYYFSAVRSMCDGVGSYSWNPGLKDSTQLSCHYITSYKPSE